MKDEYIRKRDAVHAILGQSPDAHYPAWYAAQIASLEPADVVPVVHGRWSHVAYLKGIKVMECSCCGKRVLGSHNYCGNCGAKMDGGNEA